MGKWLTEKDMKITTIYFGGGTPTSIEAEEMDELIQDDVRIFSKYGNC